jgi:uncharacterized Zn-finger protein
MPDRPHRCPYCPRRFANQNALWQHARHAHHGKKHSHLRPEQEPSLADLAIEQEIAAMGRDQASKEG